MCDSQLKPEDVKGHVSASPDIVDWPYPRTLDNGEILCRLYVSLDRELGVASVDTAIHELGRAWGWLAILKSMVSARSAASRRPSR